MRVFYSEKFSQHAPEWYIADGRVRPCPDSPKRVERIRRALAQEHDLSPPPRIGTDALMKALGRAHTAEYLRYLRTIHARWTKEFAGQPRRDVLPDTFIRRGNMPLPAKASGQAGYFCFDMAAPITAGTWEAVLDSARAAVAATECIRRGDGAAYALCRPPGHHAGADYCGGFCYLNNAAIAAEQLRAQGAQRVAVLDVDYHHGNGTQDIFYGRRDVLFASIHADPSMQYPYFWGGVSETGAGAGKGFTANYPLPRGCGAKQWFTALAQALARVKAHRPEAVVISLGVDIYKSDSVGDFKISLADFARLGQHLRSLAPLPVVFIQEGGYQLAAIGPCVAAVLCGFEASRNAASIA